MDSRHITVIDQTLREGMQFRGLMFSKEERLRILEFQEGLGVDICQAGYPSAHASEIEVIRFLRETAEKRGYRIRPAALGRALKRDVDQMAATGVQDIHLHIALGETEVPDPVRVGTVLDVLKEAVAHVRTRIPAAWIGVSILDIGRTGMDFLTTCSELLIRDLRIEILTLPDTSGVLSPGQLYNRVSKIAAMAEGGVTRVGVHCHNDMGMATANTVSGVAAGALVVEASALGIGERNGIGDLFLVGKCLADQGYKLNLKVSEIDLFRRYYEYVDGLCFKKTGIRLMDERTPFFGRSLRTHTAGSHGKNAYGVNPEAEYCLNVLCGKHLVAKFLEAHQIRYDPVALLEIVAEIKALSAVSGQSVSAEQAAAIAGSMYKK